MKRVDTSVYATIQQVIAGHFAGGTNAVFSLKNNGVGLGKISPKVPKSDVQKLQQIARDVAGGKIANIPTTIS
jgi:basic membrane lipoprotein Med (substrate-binding protein (PBP1-ABC) superfamily)